VELLFTGTFDKVFIRLDNTNQMVTAYQYYDDKKRWKADDRVGIRWNAEEAVKVIK
jgi:ABC spermidine/putrescine transporter